jgi:hypothetical protein
MAPANFSPAVKSIGKLMDMMDDNQLVLPEIQRDFVWTKKSIKLLVDSLYRGLPIGHMLVWKTPRAVEMKAADKQRLKRGVRISGFYGYLLDGQQRLTALRHLRDEDEEYPLMFYIWPDREADGEEPLYWRGQNEEESPWSIPVAEFLSKGFNVTARLNNLRADESFEPRHEETIRKDFAAMTGIREYVVGVTEFETDDYKLATELFVRFNSTGKKLRRSDLSVAELAIHVPGLMSKDIRRTQGKWANFPFTVPFMVQCLLAVHTGRFRLEDPGRFWAEAKPNEIKDSWKATERAIARVVDFLTGTVRWTSESLIPSFNALIPLVVILARSDGWSTEERRLARKWLILASIRGYFSGSVQTELDKVLRAIELQPTIGRLWTATRSKLRRLRPTDFDTGRLSGPVMSLFLSMVRDRGARDWQNTDSPLDGTVVGHGAALQVHHFFPKALLNKQRGLTYAEINTFANYSLLSANTNLNVSTEEPGTYLDRLAVPESELRKQCIPLDRKLWRVTRYRDFLGQRRKLLAQQANEFLGA